MSFKISSIRGNAQNYPLPVAVIKNFTQNSVTQPFTQAAFCVNESGFIASLWTFELNRSYDSKTSAVFNFCPDNGNKAVLIEVFGDNSVKCSLLIDENKAGEIGFLSRELSGEDLQGVYGGAEVTIPTDVIKKIYSGNIAIGSIIKGNVYKYCSSESNLHYGSFYKTGGNINDFFADKYYGSFEVVKY